MELVKLNGVKVGIGKFIITVLCSRRVVIVVVFVVVKNLVMSQFNNQSSS
jgi:hypothetical protein